MRSEAGCSEPPESLARLADRFKVFRSKNGNNPIWPHRRISVYTAIALVDQIKIEVIG